jgi:hypothetical protein
MMTGIFFRLILRLVSDVIDSGELRSPPWEGSFGAGKGAVLRYKA